MAMYRFQAMNTSIDTYYLDERHSRQTESWFRHAEKTLSRFLDDSELSQLNRTINVPFLASDVLYSASAAANRFYRETDGLFNPYLCDDLCRIGYDRSFEKIRSGRIDVAQPADERQRKGERLPPDFHPHMKMITIHGASIDLGGIGKGWTAQKAAEQLQKKVPRGGIAAGGDIVLFGTASQNWTVTISDPAAWAEKLFSFRLDRPAGIATSSTVKRSWKDKTGKTFHHILDPATRRSARSDLIQITVIAPDLPTAEAYAKCMIILGWARGSEWVKEKRPDLGLIGVKDDRSVVSGGAIHDYASEGLMIFARTARVPS